MVHPHSSRSLGMKEVVVVITDGIVSHQARTLRVHSFPSRQKEDDDDLFLLVLVLILHDWERIPCIILLLLCIIHRKESPTHVRPRETEIISEIRIMKSNVRDYWWWLDCDNRQRWWSSIKLDLLNVWRNMNVEVLSCMQTNICVTKLFRRRFSYEEFWSW